MDVRLWGESYVRNTIPAFELEDQWAITFSKFLLHVSGVRLASARAEHTLAADHQVVDVKAFAAPSSLGVVSGVAPGELDQVQFEFSGASERSTSLNATEADVALMKSNRYSLYVEGTAQHATRGTITFRWGFRNATRYASCARPQGAPGITVAEGPATTIAQLTYHADHLFFDAIHSHDALLRFDAIAAADRNMDRVVTLDELAMVPMSSLPAGQYQVGAAVGIETLRDFVTALTATTGHLNGEGACVATAL